MAFAKIITWIFIAIIGALALYLGILNRASERIATNFPIALAVSGVGALLTLFFSLQKEEKASTFPVEYVIDSGTMLPYTCEFLPPMGLYADPGWNSGGGPAFVALTQFANEKHQVIAVKDDPKAVGRLYRNVLLRQMLDTLRFAYLKSWDAGPSRFSLPTSDGSETIYSARKLRAGVQISNEQLVQTLKEPAAGSSTFKFLNVPPRTRVIGVVTDQAVTLTFDNPFVSVDIRISSRGVAEDLGKLQGLCRVSTELSRRYRRPSFEVALHAEFNELRSGHPDMPLYRHWVEVMFAELQRFDARTRWDDLSREYLLLYAHRTTTPLQDLMAETIKKAQRQ
jgi:hypothetical protein